MKNRMIVRSLTTDEGTLVAMDDGLLAWKPKNGRAQRIALDSIPTVLLVIRGPMNCVDTAVIGNARGEVIILTLPRLEIISKFVLNGGCIRALSIIEPGNLSLLAGTQNGEVWLLDERTSSRQEQLFSITGPVSSLHLEQGIVHVRSGWIHHMHAWDGSQISQDNTAKNYSQGGHKRLDRSYPAPSIPSV
jgi:hypothetical protein